jgi:hypothetical protein
MTQVLTIGFGLQKVDNVDLTGANRASVKRANGASHSKPGATPQISSIFNKSKR